VVESQAKAVIHEIEDICRNHGLWYNKVIEYKDGLSIIRIQEISVKIDRQRNDR
jgi:hypothetical protein